MNGRSEYCAHFKHHRTCAHWRQSTLGMGSCAYEQSYFWKQSKASWWWWLFVFESNQLEPRRMHVCSWWEEVVGGLFSRISWSLERVFENKKFHRHHPAQPSPTSYSNSSSSLVSLPVSQLGLIRDYINAIWKRTKLFMRLINLFPHFGAQ